jgi:hypothetical protein
MKTSVTIHILKNFAEFPFLSFSVFAFISTSAKTFNFAFGMTAISHSSEKKNSTLNEMNCKNAENFM